MASTHHNPERRSWKGRSYKKGGKRIRPLKDKDAQKPEKAPR